MDKKAKEFPTLVTERLVLREIKSCDATAIYSYLSDKEVIEYLEGNVSSIKEAQAYIEWITKGFIDGRDIRWGIELKETDELIGDCGLGCISEFGKPTELGYILAKDYWNKGLISESVGAILEYGFKELKLHRIQAWVQPRNIASKKILLEYGFEYEGVLREYIYIWRKKQYTDVEMYALLQKDFLE